MSTPPPLVEASDPISPEATASIEASLAPFVSAIDAAAWRTALCVAQPTAAQLLPVEAPTGSHSAETGALLGDAWLRAAVLLELGAGAGSATVGALTVRASGALGNALLAAHAQALLCGFAGAPLEPSALAPLGEHGRATAVEAAVFVMQAHAGADRAGGVRALARALLDASLGVHQQDAKGALLAARGTIESEDRQIGGLPSWVAIARLGERSSTSVVHSIKRRAEAEAASLLLSALSAAHSTVTLGPVSSPLMPLPLLLPPRVDLRAYVTGTEFNLKGALLERGGTVSDALPVAIPVVGGEKPPAMAADGGGGGGGVGASTLTLFTSTAVLGEFEATSPPLPRKTLAETVASARVLVAAGLLSESDCARALAVDPLGAPFSRADMTRYAAGGTGGPAWKTMLLERGGAVAVSMAPGGNATAPRFVARATWRELVGSSAPMNSKRAAEASASERVLREAGLVPPDAG